MNAKQMEVLNNLKIQAMMFDMDIDWETVELTVKVKEIKEPFWITNWKEKTYDGDYTAIDNGN